MGRKEEKKLDTEAKLKKRDKKRKEGAPKPGIVDVLNCPPVARFHYELVVGNGIGDDAVEDALEAFKRAWEARRQKAYEAARATETPGSVGRTVLWNLISNPFGGTVFPVNPKRPSVLGIKAYPTIAAVPEKVDLAVIVTPAATVPKLVG